MAKIIKLTPEYLEEVRQDFEAALAGMKLSDGKINFTKTFGTINRKATVFFTEIAWQKMQALLPSRFTAVQGNSNTAVKLTGIQLQKLSKGFIFL